ncbi:hypothetical protein SAMN04487969_101628 [Paenibacillus algorifonticola]|uniref:Lipoprotein n=1 Tax=Paenibacillus algorifonticola TaxID=684063 RepID=A0A1I1YLQ1_9BACL|nr:hypothetical protein [Paenibacillus algorifonticola]SFE20447.1 hypothetical protein SAMN04487969_101628 [Paenibacillus algorifonticola]
MRACYTLVIICLLLTSACSGADTNTGSVEPEAAPISASAASNISGQDYAEGASQVDSEFPVTSAADDEAEAADFESLVPAGWKVLEIFDGEPEQAEADLNNDGLVDIAAVLEKEDISQEAPDRAIMIAFGQTDHTYKRSVIAEQAVMRANEGGIYGDPFESLTIEKGVLVLRHFGGSNSRWYNTYRFRYQDNDWYLIGATTGSYFTGNELMDNADEDDYNLLTGEFVKKTWDEEAGEQVIERGNRGKKALVKIQDFDVRAAEPQY